MLTFAIILFPALRPQQKPRMTRIKNLYSRHHLMVLQVFQESFGVGPMLSIVEISRARTPAPHSSSPIEQYPEVPMHLQGRCHRLPALILSYEWATYWTTGYQLMVASVNYQHLLPELSHPCVAFDCAASRQ